MPLGALVSCTAQLKVFLCVVDPEILLDIIFIFERLLLQFSSGVQISCIYDITALTVHVIEILARL